MRRRRRSPLSSRPWRARSARPTSRLVRSGGPFSHLGDEQTADVPRAHAVAIAYVMQKTPYVFPIIGGRKVEHLHANIEALNIALTPEHIKRIEGAVPFELGFPTAFVVS